MHVTIEIPPQPATSFTAVFNVEHPSPFVTIDSNLAAWLPTEFPATEAVMVQCELLGEHMDNGELIKHLGGVDTIAEKHLFTPQQVRYLAEHGHLQQNGLSNLFFLRSAEDNSPYIVGVVFDVKLHGYAPYIYRPRNRYRAWTKGNQLFSRP